MNANSSLCSLIFGAALVVAPGVAQAQYRDLNWNVYNNPTSAMLGDWISIKMQEDAMRRAFGRREQQEASPPRAKSARPAPTTTFKPVRSRLAITKTPVAKRPQMEKLIGACGKVFQQTLARFGVSDDENNLALSLAFAIAMDHSVYWLGNTKAPRLADKRHFGRLRDVMRTYLVAREKLGKLDDAHKQEMHDHLVLMGCTPIIQYQAGKKAGNEGSMSRAREAAGKNLKALGLDPGAVRFEEDGNVTFVGK